MFIHSLPEQEMIELLNDRKNYSDRFYRKISAIIKSAKLDGIAYGLYYHSSRGGVSITQLATDYKKTILIKIRFKCISIEPETKMNKLLKLYNE